MPVRTHSCITVDCDVCGAPLQDFDDTTLHFPNETEASKLARYYRWPVSTGGRFICDRSDADHQAAIDELLPTFTLVPDGQMTFDDAPAAGTDAGSRSEQ